MFYHHQRIFAGFWIVMQSVTQQLKTRLSIKGDGRLNAERSMVKILPNPGEL
jgi:hypothetical protein